VYIPYSGTGGVNLIASNLLLTDTDSDGMTDGFEYFYNLNPLSAADAATDLDFDGVSNLWEYRLGTHPRQKDSNGNGIEDGAEDQDADGLATSFELLTSQTNPSKSDTDGDRLPDGWEYRNNLNPNSGAGNDGRAGDPDVDGLTNLLEYLNGTNPFLVDSDIDGTSDIIEINQAGNPNNSNDGGLAPPGPVKEVSFKLGGDYTSWEMLITGKGPGDDRPLKVITPSPGDAEIVSHKLRPGNTYEISLTYTGTKAGETQKWYCWESLIDALPNAITFPDYTSTRVPAVGEFFTVGGGGWLVDNHSGLLSGHSHHNETSGGNPTAGLVATLLPAGLQSVTFSGAGSGEFFTVKADDGTDFAAPHWKDKYGDGNLVKTDDDHTYPVAFVRNKVPHVAASIKLNPGQTGVRLKASNEDGFSLTTNPLTVPADGIVEIPATSLGQPLPNTVFHYPAFKLTWEVSVNGGAWSRIGESRTPLYVLRAAPVLGLDGKPGASAMTELRYTLIHKSCVLASGEALENQIISSVGSMFINLNAQRMRYDPQAGTATVEPVYYYKDWKTSDPELTKVRVNELLAIAPSPSVPSCECYVFCEMFRDMLKIQGIFAQAPVIRYWQGPESERFLLVQHWDFIGTGTSGKAEWPYTPAEYSAGSGSPGQNNSDTPNKFHNHCLVELETGVFYDPSYGGGPYFTLTSHDWAAFSGFSGRVDGIFFAKKNPQATLNTTITSYR
jgi:hypothetical protein